LVILSLIKIDPLLSIAKASFDEYDIAGGRAHLYSHGLALGLDSFLVGRGVGPHIWGAKQQYWDSHQTILTVFLQTGIVGVILILRLFLKVIRRQFRDPAIFAATVSIILYASGGDILRRLPIWLMLVLFYYYSDERESSDVAMS